MSSLARSAPPVGDSCPAAAQVEPLPLPLTLPSLATLALPETRRPCAARAELVTTGWEECLNTQVSVPMSLLYMREHKFNKPSCDDVFQAGITELKMSAGSAWRTALCK